ncbi:hypothetical protein H4582DRAFT_1528294 [Lactarius indigo]|nr:hypothetical protein H4582DRAFT_1528294 [Lactarius indigo]
MGIISILATIFDCLNMFVVIWHYVRRGSLGSLGQSILRQGILVYVVMTALNALAIGTFLSSNMVHEGLGSASSFSFILPSPLSCRLVLMLRRKASPTETELRIEYSHMVNEVIEMAPVKWRPEEVSGGFVPFISTDTEAQP